MVGREDHPERRDNRVEALVLVRQRLGVTLLEPDLEPGLGRGGPGLLELARREVEPRDLRAAPRGDERDAAGAAGEVEETLSTLRRDQVDEALVNRGERLRDALVGGAAPDGRAVAQLCSPIALFVSSVRTFQSSG